MPGSAGVTNRCCFSASPLLLIALYDCMSVPKILNLQMKFVLRVGQCYLKVFQLSTRDVAEIVNCDTFSESVSNLNVLEDLECVMRLHVQINGIHEIVNCGNLQ